MSASEGARWVISFPLKVLTAAIGLLILFLVVGWLLPARWEVERSTLVAAPPAAVFAAVDDPSRWGEWAPLGDVDATYSGPPRGPGAARVWNDPEFGDGVFTIVSTRPDQEVKYRVAVQEGSMVTEGTVTLAPEGEGTRVTWLERGDFGQNPLMGYMARSMDRLQGAQMEVALARLGAQVAAAP